MLFNSTSYLIFFVIVFVIYRILPRKLKNLFLLGASYYYYMRWNPFYIILLVGVTAVTYFGAITIENARVRRKAVAALTSGATVALGLLGVFKYFNFFIGGVNRVLAVTGQDVIPWTSRLILPVGISFYTLQSLGYLIDVYRKECSAERNPLRYALFVAFFPQISAGPIGRSKLLLTQFREPHNADLGQVRKGLLLMLWGLFVKMVIADRAALFVDAVYTDPATYGGLYIVVATLLFSIQIYGDFYGYSTIARGTALTFGITLTDNFCAPYFSENVKEFWRRWHISLSTWFRDYLYIPLGGSRKGKLRQMLNLMIVFCVSGLWHGSSLGYLFWGFLNGAYQVAGALLTPVKSRITEIRGGADRAADRIIRRGITFGMISFAWLFFRAGSIGNAICLIKHMVAARYWKLFFDDSIYSLGIDRRHFVVLLFSILLMLWVDHQKYHKIDVAARLLSQYSWVRVLAEMTLVFLILLFGCYGDLYDAASFIYFKF